MEKQLASSTLSNAHAQPSRLTGICKRAWKAVTSKVRNVLTERIVTLALSTTLAFASCSGDATRFNIDGGSQGDAQGQIADGGGKKHDGGNVIQDAGNDMQDGGSDSLNGESSNIWTRKMNPDGREIWTRTYNGPSNLLDYVSNIALGPDGSVYAIGTEDAQILRGTSSALILKYCQSE